MTREWQPGDVALVTDSMGRGGRGMCNAVGGWDFTPEGSRFSCYSGKQEIVAARPLVVIDPDDDTQIEWLLAALDRRGWAVDGDTSVSDMQAALREFADPPSPRPDEPQGLGAVIEDNECEVWVRADAGSFAWRRTGMSGDEYKSYAQINAVRVLSPGYDPEATR